MNLKETFAGEIRFGDPVKVHGLGVIPLLSEVDQEMESIILLDEALAMGAVKITEIDDAGNMAFLKVENSGSSPLLILEGDELVGGKQNRVVNASIIVTAGSTIKVPVSCMEARRWHYQGENFDSGKAIFRAKSRALHKRNVSLSLRAEGSYRGSQGAVWDEVSASLVEFGASSPTSDYRAAREIVSHRVEQFVEAIHPMEHQIGGIFLSRGGILGAELLGTEELFGKALPKIIRSFALEVLSSSDVHDVSIENAREWWEKVLSAPLTKHASPGAGDDMRLDAMDLLGSGLYWSGSLVHFSCLPIEVNPNLLMLLNAPRIPTSRTPRTR